MSTFSPTPRLFYGTRQQPQGSEHRPACSLANRTSGQRMTDTRHRGRKGRQHFSTSTPACSYGTGCLGSGGDIPHLVGHRQVHGLTSFVCSGGPPAQFPMAASVTWLPVWIGKGLSVQTFDNNTTTTEHVEASKHPPRDTIWEEASRERGVYAGSKKLTYNRAAARPTCQVLHGLHRERERLPQTLVCLCVWPILLLSVRQCARTGLCVIWPSSAVGGAPTVCGGEKAWPPFVSHATLSVSRTHRCLSTTRRVWRT